MSKRTQSRRLWLGGGAGISVLILAIGWFAMINPQLSAAAATRDQADAARMQNVQLESKNAKLKKQNDNIAALRAGLATALAELPSDGGLPAFTRQISAQATATSVALTSVIVGAAAPVPDAASAAAAGTTTTATADNGTTTPAAAPAAPAASGAAAPTAAPASLVQITITVIATGLGRQDLAFLHAIQVTGPRRALVTASQLAPTAGGATGVDGPCTLTLTLTVFSAPLAPTAQAALEKLLSGK